MLSLGSALVRNSVLHHVELHSIVASQFSLMHCRQAKPDQSQNVYFLVDFK